MAPSLLDDESDSNQKKNYFPLTRKECKSLNRNLNLLARYGESFYSSAFTKIISHHEATIKRLLSKNVKLVLKNEKLLLDHTKKMDVALNEIKELRRLLFNDNTFHVDITYTIHDLAQNFDSKTQMVAQTERTNVKELLKQEIHFMKEDIAKKDDDVVLVNACNIDINQRITKISKVKDAPYVDHISILLDDKLEYLFTKTSDHTSSQCPCTTLNTDNNHPNASSLI